jgi:hydroxyacylglutathione hydrolase
MAEWQQFGPVWFIPGENHGKYPFCHSVYVEGAGVLIDPASDRVNLARLREDPGVKMVWLTHCHEDHFMHLDLFDDLPIWISELEAPPLSDPELFLDSYGMDNEDYRKYWRTVLKEQFNFRSRKPARFLLGGEIIDLGTVSVEVIATPGHTPGHLAFFFKEPEVLFMGDYDLTGFGPFYGDLGASIEDTIASVEYLRTFPAKVWLTSHETGIFEDEPGRLWDRYLIVIKEREERILDLLEKPRNIDEIVGAWIVYGRPREPKAFYEFAERALIKKHLERLVKLGIVLMKGDQYYSSWNWLPVDK